MKIAVLLLFSVLSCICAWAAEEDLLPTDQPLNQPVTLAVKGEALSDIMAMLSKQTGVKLRTTRDIADQKATIFVDKRPLREVITGLQTIFGYRFSVVPVGDRKVYELWESLSTKQAREAAMSGAVGEAWQEMDARMRKVIGLSGGDQSRFKELEAKQDRTPEENAEFRLLRAAFGVGADLAKLCLTLPPELRRFVQPGCTAFFDTETSDAEWRLPEEIDESLTKKVTASPYDWPGRPSAGYNVDLTFVLRGQRLVVFGTCKGIWPESGKTWGLGTDFGGDSIVPKVKPERPAVRLPQSQDDGTLGKEVTFTSKELADEGGISRPTETGSPMYVNRSDVLALLHSKLGLQVISDHYSVWFAWDVNGAQTVKRLLEHFAEMKTTPDSRSFWGHELKGVADPMRGWDGTYLYTRERFPYELDAAEVPNSFLTRLRTSLAARRCLDLDDIASMLLCERQRAATCGVPWDLLLLVPGVGPGSLLLYPDTDSRPALQLYASLGDAQRRRALADGVRISDMSPDQLDCLADLLRYRKRSVWDYRFVGLWENGVRIDKPQPDEDTPVLMRVDRRSSQRFLLTTRQNTSNAEKTEAATPGEAVTWFREHHPNLFNKAHFLGKDAGYVMVLEFADGTTKEYPVTIYEPVEESSEPASKTSQ